MKASFSISQYSNLTTARGVSNDPLYSIAHGATFIAPSEGYVRVAAQGVLSMLNLKDSTYIIMLVNRDRYPTTQISQSLFVKKGVTVKWEADDSTSTALFLRSVI